MPTFLISNPSLSGIFNILFDSIDNVSKKLILELPTEIPIHIIIKANKTLIIT